MILNCTKIETELKQVFNDKYCGNVENLEELKLHIKNIMLSDIKSSSMNDIFDTLTNV